MDVAGLGGDPRGDPADDGDRRADPRGRGRAGDGARQRLEHRGRDLRRRRGPDRHRAALPAGRRAIAAFGAATAYTIVAADQGKTITAQVRRTDSAVPPQVLTVDVAGSAVIPAAIPPMTATAAPTLAAAVAPGTALGSVWTIAGGTFAGGVAPIVTERRFLRDGAAIAAFGAATAYTIVAADQGKTITAQVRRTDSAVPPQVLTVDATGAAVIPAPAPAADFTVNTTAQLLTAMVTAAGQAGPKVIACNPGDYAALTRTNALVKVGKAANGTNLNNRVTVISANRNNPATWRDASWSLQNLDGFTFDGLRFLGTTDDGFGFARLGVQAVNCQDLANVTFRNCAWDGWCDNLAVTRSVNLTIEWNDMKGAGRDSVRLFDRHQNLLVQNNDFDGFRADGSPGVDYTRSQSDDPNRHADFLSLQISTVGARGGIGVRDPQQQVPERQRLPPGLLLRELHAAGRRRLQHLQDHRPGLHRQLVRDVPRQLPLPQRMRGFRLPEQSPAPDPGAERRVLGRHGARAADAGAGRAQQRDRRRRGEPPGDQARRPDAEPQRRDRAQLRGGHRRKRAARRPAGAAARSAPTATSEVDRFLYARRGARITDGGDPADASKRRRGQRPCLFSFPDRPGSLPRRPSSARDPNPRKLPPKRRGPSSPRRWPGPARSARRCRPIPGAGAGRRGSASSGGSTARRSPAPSPASTSRARATTAASSTARSPRRNAAGAAVAVAGPLRLRHAPPAATGDLPEEVFDLGAGPQVVETGAAFSGAGLTFSAAGPPGVAIDPRSGALAVSTDRPVTGAVVIITAANSGGTAAARLVYTVEADDAASPAPWPLGPGCVEVARSVWLAGPEPAFSPRLRFPGLDGAVAIEWTADSGPAARWGPVRPGPSGEGLHLILAPGPDPSGTAPAPFHAGGARLRFRWREMAQAETQGDAAQEGPWSPPGAAFPVPLPPAETLPPPSRQMVRAAMLGDGRLRRFNDYDFIGYSQKTEGPHQSTAVRSKKQAHLPTITALAAFAGDDRRYGGATPAERAAETLAFWAQNRVPAARGGVGMQSDLMFANCAALGRATPAVWEAVGPQDRARIDLAMQGLLVSAAWQNSDANPWVRAGDPRAERTLTGGDYSRNRVPNFSSSSAVMPFIVAAYLGTAEAEALLAGFEREAFAEAIRAAGEGGALDDLEATFATDWTDGPKGPGPTAAELAAAIRPDGGYRHSGLGLDAATPGVAREIGRMWGRPIAAGIDPEAAGRVPPGVEKRPGEIGVFECAQFEGTPNRAPGRDAQVGRLTDMAAWPQHAYAGMSGMATELDTRDGGDGRLGRRAARLDVLRRRGLQHPADRLRRARRARPARPRRPRSAGGLRPAGPRRLRHALPHGARPPQLRQGRAALGRDGHQQRLGRGRGRVAPDVRTLRHLGPAAGALGRRLRLRRRAFRR